MEWKKWLTTAAIVIAVTNIVAVSTIPDRIIGLNVAILAGMFSGVAFLTWWQNQNQSQSDEAI